MKTLCRCLVLTIAAALAPYAHAQCPNGTNGAGPCVTSFSISPGTIIGDNTQYATATATIHLPQGTVGTVLEIKPGAGHGYSWNCIPPGKNAAGDGTGAGFAGGCTIPGVTGDFSVQVQLTGSNTSASPITINLTADNAYSNDPGKQASLTLNPVPASEDPSQDPDGPCPETGCSSGGAPINFTNGDTWIEQRDYSIPGLGGGLTLTRTWNSLWSLAQPPEQSGIFGESWRSTFEERIQALPGGVVKYWKGNGSKLFYSYDSFSGAYLLTAPADDQTSLSFDSGTTQWTVSQKNGTRRIFNSAGYLTSIIDRNGNTITVAVDAANQNRIASVTDAAGRVLTFNYANANFPRLCTAISDSVGTIASYSYDTSGRLTQVSYADGSQFNFSYNASNLILSVTDSHGKAIESHTYDSQRRGLTSQQANNVNLITVSYSSSGTPSTTVHNSLGAYGLATLTIATVGQRRYISKITGNACGTCTFGPGQRQRLISAAGHIGYETFSTYRPVFYTYDGQGNMITMARGTGDGLTLQVTSYNIWQHTYNSFGQVLTATDPLNNTTTNQYDTHGNLLSRTSPAPDGNTPGSTTSFTYDGSGQLLTITDPLNNQTTMTYYPTGLLHTVTDQQQNTTTYEYDARGNRTRVTDAAQNPTQFQYDSMNRLTIVTYPDQSTVQFGYDYRGRRTSVTDQNQKTTIYAYDDADRLISVTDAQTPNPGVTRYTYNTENEVTDIYDAANNHTHVDYDTGTGFPIKTTFPSGFTESYGWWGGDEPLMNSKTDRNGKTINYVYDFERRIYYRKYPDGTNARFDYDAAGRLIKAVGPTNTDWFAYDNMNRLIQETTSYTFVPSRTFVVGYGYDAASNRISLTDPENGVTHYSYDALNRLSSLNDFQSHNFSFGYDALSRRTLLTRPNGVNTGYSYDNISHLLSVPHQINGATVDGTSYTYDAVGNRTSKTDLAGNVTSNYGYDAIYRLLQVTQGPNTTETYTYDSVGNRLSSLGVSPYAYNSSNELTSYPGVTYTYDKNGSTQTKVTSSGTTTNNWDFENRLTSMVLPGSGGTISFQYDTLGRRIQKTSPSGTVNYLYDGANLLEEVDQNGNALARYTQGPGVDDPLSELRSSSTSYYEQDGVGSVTSLSNSAGNLASTYTYDSYGKLTASTGTLTNPLQYTGREFDPETGLPYYRARYYDPATGRFLTEDPVRSKGGINFYAYVHNSPLNFTDPFGLCPQQHPCAPMGSAPTPGQYQAMGQEVQVMASSLGGAFAPAASAMNLINLASFHRGFSLDAQVLYGGSTAYANYAYGVYLSATGSSLSFALNGANVYAAIVSSYPKLKPSDFDANYGFLPAANAANIINGYEDEQNGTLCSPTK